MFDKETDKRYSAFVVNVTIPATILSSACWETELSPRELLGIAAVAVLTFVLFPIMGQLVSKIFHRDGVFTCMLVYSNLGFMGIPIIQSIYGKSYVIYVAVFMMIFNISLFSYGVSKLCPSGGTRKEFLKNMVSPGILSSLIALAVFFTRVSLPSVVVSLFDSLSSITTPMAMLLIGSSLAEIRFRDVFTDWSMYFLVLLKLVVFPIVLWIILERLLSIPLEWTKIAVILSGLPVAGNISMLCMQYGKGQEQAAKGMFITTAASAITIPVLIYLLM